MSKRERAQIRLVLTDLDGTFVHNIFEPVEENVRALRRCEAAGVPVVPVTARNYACAKKLFVRAGFTGYTITNNGSSIQDARTGENLWENPISNVCLLEALSLCVEANATITAHDSYHGVHFGPHHNGQKGYLEWENERESDPDLRIKVISLDTAQQIVDFMDGHCQLLRVGFPDGVPPWFFEKLIMAGEFSITSSHSTSIEIMASGSGKGSGARALAGMLGIPRESVMACGDQANDIGMIEWAGVGVAMGNATDGPKRVADYVAPWFDRGGVADAIGRFVFSEA
jgi:Cof subfamily protein (haloacid dehalogenase superfamily)